MVRYWVIAPYNYENRAAFDACWQYDHANGVIAIGWDLGDLSNLSKEDISARYLENTDRDPKEWESKSRHQVIKFWKEIQTGDIIIARGGRKRVVGIGTALGSAFYDPEKGKERAGSIAEPFPNFLRVRWEKGEQEFPRTELGMQTLYEMPAERYAELFETAAIPESPGDTENSAFHLEKHLEDFIVANFDQVFREEYDYFRDDGQREGRQYPTDIGPIDILAREPATNAFVVIELKRDKSSDQAVGQTLRYMGWVKEHLCQGGEGVKGLIICQEADERLEYALKMTTNITHKLYRVDFQLEEPALR